MDSVPLLPRTRTIEVEPIEQMGFSRIEPMDRNSSGSRLLDPTLRYSRVGLGAREKIIVYARGKMFLAES